MKAVEGCTDVFHLAAAIQLTGAHKRGSMTSTWAARNVVDCLAHGVKRLVHVSSIHALEQNRLRGGRRSDVSGCQPSDEYGRTKVLSTRRC